MVDNRLPAPQDLQILLRFPDKEIFYAATTLGISMEKARAAIRKVVQKHAETPTTKLIQEGL